MKLLKILLFLIIVNLGYSQEDNKGLRMVDFSPKSHAYNIYFPNNYLVNEEDNIVTITNVDSGLNITLSSYSNQNKIQEENIIDLLSGFVKEIKKSDWKSYKSKFDNLIEGRIEKENDNWIWWGITLDKTAVIISINKEKSITDEEIKLLRFMIENLEIH